MARKLAFPDAMQKCARLFGGSKPYPWIQPAPKPQKASGGLQSKYKLSYQTSKMAAFKPAAAVISFRSKVNIGALCLMAQSNT